MESDKSNRKYGHIDYSTRLWGIAPFHWRFIMDSPWATKNLKLCKKPSQYSNGQLEVSDESALVETAIVERRILSNESEYDKNESDDVLSESEFITLLSSSSICENDAIESSEESSVDEKEARDPPATRFVKQCLDHLLVESK